MKLKNNNKNFIDGKWVDGKSDIYNLLNPYDNSLITKIKLANKEQVSNAFNAANDAYKAWSSKPSLRKEVLNKVKNYFEDNQEEIIKLLALESGSTYVKSQLELNITIECITASINNVDEIGVTSLSDESSVKESLCYKKPKGVISSISPFNFPLFLSIRTIIPALALGNAVVHKGDIQTAYTGGIIIAKALEEAGLPKGLFNMLLADPKEIGDIMFDHPLIDFVSFTGSTKVGMHIGAVAGSNLKEVALELGGNAPFIVLSDSNIDAAVNAAIFGKFIHQGQICMIVNRIIVHEDLYDEFIEKFVEKAQSLKFGNPLERENVIGPIINESQINKIKSIIESAKNKETPLALEGKQIGNILTPTIFTDVDNDSELAQTEIFGPIASIIQAHSDEDAIEKANRTEYGLSAAIFTSDLEKGEELAKNLEFGMTHVNDQTVANDEGAPFGGIKKSGVGRFGFPYVVDEFTELNWVTVRKADENKYTREFQGDHDL